MKKSKKSISEVRRELEQRTNMLAKRTVEPSGERRRTLEEVFRDSENIEFNCTSVCRIDDDLHDIFTRLKKKNGVRIGKLVSVILKDFFDSNRREIKAILEKNKYL